MRATETIVHIDAETPAGRLIDAHPRESIVPVRGDRRFLLVPEDPWDDYDPKLLRAALREVAGTFTPEQGEQLKQILYRRREVGTQHPNRS